MHIHIPKHYLIMGGVAVAAGLAFWYLKANGYWDSWFAPTQPAPEPVPATQTQPGLAGGFNFPAPPAQKEAVN